MRALNDFLRAKVKDRVTGFEGICMGYLVYATGCNQISIHPPVNKDGEVPDNKWIDAERVEIVNENAYVPVEATEIVPAGKYETRVLQPTGGPGLGPVRS